MSFTRLHALRQNARRLDWAALEGRATPHRMDPRVPGTDGYRVEYPSGAVYVLVVDGLPRWAGRAEDEEADRHLIRERMGAPAAQIRARQRRMWACT